MIWSRPHKQGPRIWNHNIAAGITAPQDLRCKESEMRRGGEASKVCVVRSHGLEAGGHAARLSRVLELPLWGRGGGGNQDVWNFLLCSGSSKHAAHKAGRPDRCGIPLTRASPSLTDYMPLLHRFSACSLGTEYGSMPQHVLSGFGVHVGPTTRNSQSELVCLLLLWLQVYRLGWVRDWAFHKSSVE